MKYRNTNPTYPLEFSFGDKDFVVPVGGEVTIDDKWHPWVVSRGLYLELVPDAPAPEPVAEPAPEPEPTPERKPGKPARS